MPCRYFDSVCLNTSIGFLLPLVPVPRSIDARPRTKFTSRSVEQISGGYCEIQAKEIFVYSGSLEYLHCRVP
jgi:hypothetical protein